MQIEPHIIFNARRAQKERKRHGAQISLSLSVCVYIHMHACIRVSLRIFLLAQKAHQRPPLSVSRVKLGNILDSVRAVSLFLIDRLWSLAPKERPPPPPPRSKAENAFVRSFVLLSFVDTQRLFSFSLSNPIVIQNRRERAKESYRRSRKSSTRTSTSEAWWTSTLRRKIRKSLRSGQSCWRFLFSW